MEEQNLNSTYNESGLSPNSIAENAESGQIGVPGEIDYAYFDFSHGFFINLAVLVLAFIATKYVFSKFIFAKRKPKDINENSAFAFSLASVIISIALIVTSSVYGDLPETWYEATLKISAYCGLGILLIISSGFIFDKLCLVKVDLARQITQNNMAAAIVESANFLASALIIMAILVWAEPFDVGGLKTLFAAYIISQLLLSITSLVWISLFTGTKENKSTFQQEISNGNVAVAVDFFGKRIATALAINIATSLLSYQSIFSITLLLRDWFLVSMIAILIIQLLSYFASRVIIGGYRNASNKIAEGNLSTAYISAATYIAFGIIIDKIVI